MADLSQLPAESTAVSESLEFRNSRIVHGLMAAVTPYLTVSSGQFDLPRASRANHRTIRSSWRAELLPTLAFADLLEPWRSSAWKETGDFRRPRRSTQERAERFVNIGDDSLPEPWNPVSPSAPNRENPIKPGGLTDSCGEP